ncbi:MAG TPA: hypothetical protein VGD45_19725 [Steroidobacter sp.]|uniref:phosphorylase family protein n=1 Tax=Steroidobacter sp. TaxID=1978227 RepID=UPI002ED8C237
MSSAPGQKGSREAFLGCFSPSHRRELIEFGKRLKHIEADYLLFLARKSVCLYECLVWLKLTELRGTLLSDRVLDMDLSWLKGKRVAVVDDTVIFGSTLARIIATLHDAGAHISSVIVFCVNESSWQKERVMPTEPFLRLNEREATGFCADLVRAISVVPMPYAVDYPLIRRLRIPDKDLPVLLCMPGWGTQTHTTPIQHSHRVCTLVSTPTAAKYAEIFPEAESELRDVCRLVKVRLYGKHIGKHEATWFMVMPVAVLDPLTTGDIDRLWEAIVSGCSTQEADTLRANFISATSRLRAIQFVIAARLAEHWIRDARVLLGLRVSPRIDSSFAGFSFSPSTAALISRIAARGLSFSAVGQVHAATANILEIELPSDPPGVNPWNLQAALIKPFLYLHKTREVLARQLQPRPDEPPDPLLDRLNQGFSLAQLRQRVSAVLADAPGDAILSEFLDHVIDRGFVVPISAHHGNVVFRAYRYGEDVLDAEQFRQLCARCAQKFLETSGFPAISRTWLEKLIVLLLQELLNERLVDPTDLALGSSGTIGVRYALHGAVVKESAPHIYSHYEGMFYVDVLTDYGYFKKLPKAEKPAESVVETADEPPETGDSAESSQSGTHYLPVVNADVLPEAARAVESAEQLGLLVGTLACRTDTPLLTIHTLTLLATCDSPASTAGALSAEIDIMRRSWRFTRQKIANGELVSQQVVRNERWFTAINSARFKYSNYLLDEAEKSLGRIEMELSNATQSDRRFALVHLKAFRRTRMSRNKYSGQDPSYTLLLQLGRYIFELNILARLLLMSLPKADPDAIAELQTELAVLVTQHDGLLARAGVAAKPEHRIRDHLIRAVHRVSSPDIDRTALFTWTVKHLGSEVIHANELLARVDHVIARVGLPNPFETFPHVLVVECQNPRETNRIESALNRVCLQCTKEFNGRLSGSGRAYPYVFRPDGEKAPIIAVGFRGDSSRGLLERVRERLLTPGTHTGMSRIFGFYDIGREEQPLKSDSSSRCVAGAFFERVAACRIHPSLQSGGFYKLEPNEDQLQFQDRLAAKSSDSSVVIAAPTEKHYQVSHTNTRPAKATQKSVTKADIAIVCTTASELRAVRASLSGLADYKQEEKFFYSATLPGNGCRFRVVMTFLPDPGTVTAATTASDFVRRYRPKLLVLLGMAGAIHEDVKLLDVVLSTQVIYYEPRKERDGKVSSRLQALPISSFLKRAVISFVADKGAPAARISYTEQDSVHDFGIFEGPLGSGDAVVGSTNSAARAVVKGCNDKALIMETEAWGAHKAVFDLGGSDCKHVLTIKGAADNADSEKDDSRQYRATRNAFETFREFLLTLSVQDLR